MTPLDRHAAALHRRSLACSLVLAAALCALLMRLDPVVVFAARAWLGWPLRWAAALTPAGCAVLLGSIACERRWPGVCLTARLAGCGCLYDLAVWSYGQGYGGVGHDAVDLLRPYPALAVLVLAEVVCVQRRACRGLRGLAEHCP